MTKDAEPTSVWSWLQDWAYAIAQLINLRVALAIALVAFLIAVSVDSAGNPAEAADLAAPPVSVQVVSGAAGALLVNDAASDAADLQQLSTARRLRHGMMTSAIMTSNRLTEAHFFTDLPSAE